MKPSYEELEEQLNRSRRLCDAALANERVWETTMMEACGEDGPKSVADKFAELKAKCAARSLLRWLERTKSTWRLLHGINVSGRPPNEQHRQTGAAWFKR
ncbi:hypothetical protein DN588_00590 [Enterobacter cloacae]|nr:hypothetical protein DN588_00590 [Enterobacter cloacae]